MPAHESTRVVVVAMFSCESSLPESLSVSMRSIVGAYAGCASSGGLRAVWWAAPRRAARGVTLRRRVSS